MSDNAGGGKGPSYNPHYRGTSHVNRTAMRKAYTDQLERDLSIPDVHIAGESYDGKTGKKFNKNFNWKKP